MNKADINATNQAAEVGEMTPEGISRIFVRSFSASIFQSAYRLKAMAALRAKIMQHKIRRTNFRLKGWLSIFIPRKKERKAKGKAKTVWENLISEK